MTVVHFLSHDFRSGTKIFGSVNGCLEDRVFFAEIQCLQFQSR